MPSPTVPLDAARPLLVPSIERRFEPAFPDGQRDLALIVQDFHLEGGHPFGRRVLEEVGVLERDAIAVLPGRQHDGQIEVDSGGSLAAFGELTSVRGTP
jgi:hypothetical protein